MANDMIPQSLLKCNDIFDIAAYLEEYGRTAEIMAALALRRGNEQARNVFAAFGGDIFLDGIDFTPTFTLASFLGVNHDYLVNLIVRYGFRFTKMQDDYHKDSLLNILGGEKNYEYYTDDAVGGISVQNKNRKQRILVDSAGKQTFVSPRVALCVCFLLKYGQRIPKNSLAMKILNSCENGSSYGIEAAQIFQKKMEAIHKAAQSLDSPATHDLPDELSVVSDKGDIKMTTDFFASIFKDFSREFAIAFST